MSLSARAQASQCLQAAESCACAVAVLLRNDHRYVPEDIRKRIAYLRQQLSILHSDLLVLSKETP